MKVIGITGGIASGKSAVTQALRNLCEEKGIPSAILSADRLGHAVLTTSEFKKAAWERWGASIFREIPFPTNSVPGLSRKNHPLPSPSENRSGKESPSEAIDWSRWEIDRSRLATIVFAPNAEGKARLRELNRLTHPAILKEAQTQIARHRQDGTALLFLDAPLLFETGLESRCDLVLFVDAPRSVRIRRALARNWTEEEFLHREANQITPEEKRVKADIVIPNGGDFQETIRELQNFLTTLADFSGENEGKAENSG